MGDWRVITGAGPCWNTLCDWRCDLGVELCDHRPMMTPVQGCVFGRYTGQVSDIRVGACQGMGWFVAHVDVLIMSNLQDICLFWINLHIKEKNSSKWPIYLQHLRIYRGLKQSDGYFDTYYKRSTNLNVIDYWCNWEGKKMVILNYSCLLRHLFPCMPWKKQNCFLSFNLAMFPFIRESMQLVY